MNKREAFKLRRGDRISFGNSMWSEHCHHIQWGEVVRVTENGGIKVTLLVGHDHAPSGQMAWVPYHYVLRVEWCAPLPKRRPSGASDKHSAPQVVGDDPGPIPW